MVGVTGKRCARPGCRTHPSFGHWDDGVPKFCAKHENDLHGGNIISFRHPCTPVGAEGCQKLCKWAEKHGEQPTLCDDCGPPRGADGYVRIPDPRSLGPPIVPSGVTDSNEHGATGRGGGGERIRLSAEESKEQRGDDEDGDGLVDEEDEGDTEGEGGDAMSEEEAHDEESNTSTTHQGKRKRAWR
ncbi:unnamed protein product [Ectocarpus fasciculatus]